MAAGTVAVWLAAWVLPLPWGNRAWQGFGERRLPTLAELACRMGPEHGEAVSREVAAYEQLRGPLRGFWEEEEAAEAPRRAAAITVK